MIHVGALPGSPGWDPDAGMERLCEVAVQEARLYLHSGFHGLLLENMHDLPYLPGRVGPETVAAMAVVGSRIRQAVDLPLGIQVLAGANQEAMAVALAVGARFIRAEAFVFGHVADEGWLQACAGPLLRYRRLLGAEQIKIFVDIKKKHSAHAVTADVDLVETARAAEFFRADGVIVTGTATGSPTAVDEVEAVARAVGLPVWVGSGVTPDNLALYPRAQALVVGSWIKEDGHWSRPVDPQRLKAMVSAHRTRWERS